MRRTFAFTVVFVSLVLLFVGGDLVFGSAVCEDFESGYTLGSTVGANGDWYDGGSGPEVNAGLGVGSSIGLAPASAIFTWTAHGLDWNDADFTGVMVQIDFQTDGSGHLDDDRIGWMIADNSISSSDIFGLQCDTGGSDYCIEGYWDGVSSDDRRPHIVDLPTLSADAWYRFRAVISKLTATSGSIDVILIELDASGDSVGVAASGAIANTATLGDDEPNSKYFTAATIWPAFKNYTSAGANADNACYEVFTAPAVENWTAYNDCVYESSNQYIGTNVTTFGIGSGYSGPTSGELTDQSTGGRTDATVTLTESGGVNWQPEDDGGGHDPNAGTDAYNTFHGLADMTGVIYYGSTAGWYVDLTFTDLDPSKVYTFATSAARCGSGGDYDQRKTIYTISGIDASTNSSSSGVDVISSTSVAFVTGTNETEGYIAQWTDIDPGADGSFMVRAEPHSSSPSSGRKAYAFDVFMLQETDGGPSQYILTVNTTGNGSVDLDPPGGLYDPDTEVELTANADLNWAFSEWSGDLSGSANPDTIVMDGDKTVTATFVDTTKYTLTVNVVGSGSVTPDPPSGPYLTGTEVELTAEAESGWAFDGWSGDLSGSANPDTVTMDDNKTVTATFSELQALNPGDVIISAFQSWNSVGDQDPAEFIELFNTTDQTISLTNMELISRTDNDSDGELEIDWQLSEDLTGKTIAPYSFFLIAESDVAAPSDVHDVETDMDLATGEGGFEERAIGIELLIDEQHMDHALYGRDDGQSPAGEMPPGDVAFDSTASWPRSEVCRNTLGTSSFEEGLISRQTAEDLHAGHDVLGYYTDEDALGDGYPNGVWYSPHDDSYDTYEARNSLSAAVPPPVVQYTLTVNTVGNGGVDLVPPGGVYDPDAEVELTANADPYWSFDGWSGDLTGGANPDTITMDDDKVVTATFTIPQHTLTVNVVGDGGVFLDPPGGTYDLGTVVELMAIPDLGWTFSGWSGDLTGSANPDTIAMTDDKNVTAAFVEGENSTVVCEDFEFGFTLGDTVGAHGDWFDGGEGPVVESGIGVDASIGLTPSDKGFTWTAYPFDWNVGGFLGFNVQLDFQTDGEGGFDDDRIGWTISDTSVSSDWIFGVQMDPGGGGAGGNIEAYWDGDTFGDDGGRTSIVDLPALSGDTWYRLRADFTKLTATSARIDVTLRELDTSGAEVGLVASGTIPDTDLLPNTSDEEIPNPGYFTAAGMWPVFKNYDNLDGAADNACFELILEPPTAIELASFEATAGDGHVTLTWQTAAEVNSYSFNIYRDGEKIATVPAFGDAHDYISVDRDVVNDVSYSYQLSDTDLDGTESMHPVICSVTPTAMPLAYSLSQNYPNPFNPTTEISYGLPAQTHVTLKIYNLLGQEIITLVAGQRDAGHHVVSWNALDKNGLQVASGVYFYRLETEDFSATKKMVFMK